MKRSLEAATRPLSLSLLALASFASLAACEAPRPPTQAEAPTGEPPGSTSTAPADEGPSRARGHALFLHAAGCWFGGLWSDAEGAAPSERRAWAEKRCFSLVKRLYGSEDRAKYDQIRILEAGAVDKLVGEVEKLASNDPADAAHKDALVRLTRALAAAQREGNEAHAAADTVKADLKGTIEPETLTKDEVAAVRPLRAHAALEALLKLDAGDLTAEAHALGLFAAMDRMELARALPKHLKVYAVGDAYQLVFGVAPPSVPTDPTAKLVPGTWLTYLTEVARGAGHAVPASATLPREREPWAWGGVIAGFGDRLRADSGRLGQDGGFAKIAGAAVKKLDAEWAEIPQVAASQKMIAEQEAKQKEKK
jgi:hypothetical protein